MSQAVLLRNEIQARCRFTSGARYRPYCAACRFLHLSTLDLAIWTPSGMLQVIVLTIYRGVCWCQVSDCKPKRPNWGMLSSGEVHSTTIAAWGHLVLLGDADGNLNKWDTTTWVMSHALQISLSVLLCHLCGVCCAASECDAMSCAAVCCGPLSGEIAYDCAC